MFPLPHFWLHSVLQELQRLLLPLLFPLFVKKRHRAAFGCAAFWLRAFLIEWANRGDGNNERATKWRQMFFRGFSLIKGIHSRWALRDPPNKFMKEL